MNSQTVLTWLRRAGVSKTFYGVAALYLVAIGAVDPSTIAGQELFGPHGLFDIRVWVFGHIIEGKALLATIAGGVALYGRTVADGPFLAAVGRLAEAVLGGEASPAPAGEGKPS